MTLTLQVSHVVRAQHILLPKLRNSRFSNAKAFHPRKTKIERRLTLCSLENADKSNGLGDAKKESDKNQLKVEKNRGEGTTDLKTQKTIQCSEIRPDGKSFFEVMIASMHHVDNGCIAGLIFLPSSFSQSLEFPLFLNSLVSKPIQIAIQKGGLPHALEAIGNLHEKDLQKIFVTSVEDAKSGGEFLLFDEITNERSIIPTTFIQAMAVAIRYQQPLFLEKNVLLTSNADFIDRMLLNPIARDESGDVEILSNFSKRMKILINKKMELKNDLNGAIAKEEYYEASTIQKEIKSWEEEEDLEITKILEDLREFYLNKLNIFFKL